MSHISITRTSNIQTGSLRTYFAALLISTTTAAIAEDLTGKNSEYYLDRLWPTSDNTPGIIAHKQNYLLITYNNAPNNSPTSPNVKNQVATAYNYNPTEAKFQFSLKTQIPNFSLLEKSNSIWFGYTQQSNWQVTNTLNSRPFRENNYEPELIFSHQFDKTAENQMSPRFINFGFVHQSNGQDLPRSRSWNRFYIQLGLEKKINENSSIALMIRPWLRREESLANDDNPDINQHLGHGDLELLYWHGDNLLSTVARIRSLQIDLSRPVQKSSPKSIHWHLQLFTGYGESLIDYNQSHTIVGVGISLPYDITTSGK